MRHRRPSRVDPKRATRALAALTAGLLATTAWSGAVTGVAGYRNVVELNAAVSGVVERVAGPAGTRFEKGEVIVAFDETPFAIEVEAARAAAELADREFEEAESAFGRERELFDEGSMSLVEFDRARLALLRARTAKTLAAKRLEGARYRLGLSRHVAAFDGAILELTRTVGEYVDAGSDAPRLAVVAEAGRYRASAELRADDSTGVALGARAVVRIGSESWTGTVGAIQMRDPLAGRDVSYRVDVYFEARPGAVIAGQAAEIDLP